MIGAIFKAFFESKKSKVKVKKRQMTKEQIKLYNKWRDIDKKVAEQNAKQD